MKVTLIKKASWCAQCEEAERILADLQTRDKYRDIPIEIIDEGKSPQAASGFQYQKLPNMWVGDQLIFEGEASEELVKEALETALRPKGSGGL